MISPELLRRYSFFAGFSPKDLKDLAMAGHEQAVKAGDTPFKEGDQAEHFYFLADGEMETLIDADGENISLSTLPAGEPLGWSALIEPRVYTATVRATRACRVIAFGRAEINRLMEAPAFAALMLRKLAEIVSRRLRDAQIQLVSLSARKG
jgi:CRP/FNR family cyclic AMP-dependent transcriptional regulator